MLKEGSDGDLRLSNDALIASAIKMPSIIESALATVLEQFAPTRASANEVHGFVVIVCQIQNKKTLILDEFDAPVSATA